MPGKKRKADSSSSMWGSSQSPSGSRRSNNKQSSSSSSRRGGAGAQGSGAYPYINEASASKLFEEICDEDDPHVAGMEGEFNSFVTNLFLYVIVAFASCIVDPSL